MRAYHPVFASVLVGFYVITPLLAEETKNPDGTYTSVTTEEDVNAAKAKRPDAVSTGNNHNVENAKPSAATLNKVFPEDAAKKAKKEEDRENMTQEQKDHEKKMLDREAPSAGVKVNNPNLTNTNSIPKRN